MRLLLPRHSYDVNLYSPVLRQVQAPQTSAKRKDAFLPIFVSCSKYSLHISHQASFPPRNIDVVISETSSVSCIERADRNGRLGA